MSSISAQLKKGFLDLCVLTILKKKDYYGYTLVNEISNYIEISEGTIYPLLKRFRDNEWVLVYEEKSLDGAPRKYYSLTKSGKEALRRLEKEWSTFRESVENILTIRQHE